jgi:hypothetical protein
MPERCYRELHAAIARELDRVPTKLRASTLKLEPRYVDQLRAQTTPGQGVCLLALNHTGNGDGCSSGFTVAEIEAGHTLSSAGPTSVGVVYGVVPDGVRAVTLRYRTESITVDAIKNVFIVKNPGQRLPHDGFPHTIIWRGADNAIIKTINDE